MTIQRIKSKKKIVLTVNHAGQIKGGSDNSNEEIIIIDANEI